MNKQDYKVLVDKYCIFNNKKNKNIGYNLHFLVIID